jgi:hypothetical protein
MTRRSLALALLFASGCLTGTLNNDPPDPRPDAGSDPGSLARAAFDTDVKPLLTSFCAGCHVAAQPAFMADDMYTTMMGWPGLIDLTAPTASLLLTKGSHQGPAWTSDQRPPIEAWLELEVTARGSGT